MNQFDILTKTLGYPGRMISGSKSGYRNRYPNRFPIFNANICTANCKIWYGDVDIVSDHIDLIAAACYINEPIYVLYEMDGRFENEAKPLISKFVAKYSPDGGVEYDSYTTEFIRANCNELIEYLK